MTFFGWDGSDWDLNRGPVDVVSIVRDLGNPCFVSHKATEGTRFKHVNYGNVIRAARAAGATFTGAYVVPRTPGNNGNGTIVQQVDYLLAYLDQETPGWRGWADFFVQVDLEHWSDANGVVYDAVAPIHGVQMAILIEARSPRKALLYAPQWAYGNSIGGSHALWASDYGANPATHFRAAYPGDNSGRWQAYSGRVPAILQYGSRLTIGNQPSCDANAYRGTAGQFANMIGGNDMAFEQKDKENLSITVEILTAMAKGDERTWNQPVKAQQILNRLDRAADAEKVRDAATAATLAGQQATIDKLLDVVTAGGGNVELAAIREYLDTKIAQVQARAEELAVAEKAADEQRHREEMASLQRGHSAEVAGLQAKLTALGGSADSAP